MVADFAHSFIKTSISLPKISFSLSILQQWMKYSHLAVNLTSKSCLLLSRVGRFYPGVFLPPKADKTRQKSKLQFCKYCKLLDKSGNIISHYTHEHHHCMKNISCRSSNVIYCLTCNNCGKQYVGQTLRRIKDRLYEHLRDIDTLNKDKPLGVHFSQSCQANPSIKVHILEFIKKPPRSPEALIIRNRIEKRWIHLLRTPVPLGLNLED